MEWIFDCMACGGKDMRQSGEIALRYIKDKKGVAGNVQCCKECARLIDEDTRNERAKEEKRRVKAASKSAAKAAKSSGI